MSYTVSASPSTGNVLTITAQVPTKGKKDDEPQVSVAAAEDTKSIQSSGSALALSPIDPSTDAVVTQRTLLTDESVEALLRANQLGFEKEAFAWARINRCKHEHCNRGFHCAFRHDDQWRVRLSKSYFLLISQGSRTYTIEHVPDLAMQRTLANQSAPRVVCVEKVSSKSELSTNNAPSPSHSS